MPSLKVALSLKVATAQGAGAGRCPRPGLPSHLGLAQGALLGLCQRRGGQQAEDAGNQEGAREGHGRLLRWRWRARGPGARGVVQKQQHQAFYVHG